VINAASDLLFKIFGEKGQHARIAVGVASLPLDSMTEIDVIVETV
jgi:enamine deaminase RidA (YjgF/YER057c/UK114 family)